MSGSYFRLTSTTLQSGSYFRLTNSMCTNKVVPISGRHPVCLMFLVLWWDDKTLYAFDVPSIGKMIS
eukprot:2997809-Amphidinium_carterae.1